MDRIQEIGAKMDALNIWEKIFPYNWAVKPAHTALPYFCMVLKGDKPPVKVRFFLLEGWQTMHDFVRTRLDRNFGYYSEPVEFPHFELIILHSGEMKLFRYDPGYFPCAANERQCEFVARILWEAYGVMLRIESDATLPIKYAESRAIFARVEKSDGAWVDEPLTIPSPPQLTENVSFEKADLAKAKDLPFAAKEFVEADFRLMTLMQTTEKRPRCVYQLFIREAATRKVIADIRVSVASGCGLKSLWEGMPPQFLKAILAHGRIPGEVRVKSGRVFRLLRSLCLTLPFKLSLRDSIADL